MKKKIPMRDTLTVKTSFVLPPDTNQHGTLFGGKLMAYIDDIASITATKFARRPVVTASTDSVDFLKPINSGDSVTLEARITYTGRTSMEVFVKVTSENLLTGEKAVAALSFLTFVALDENGKPTEVPEVVPESEEERWLNETALNRAEHRKARKLHSQELAQFFSKMK
ncbi:MAG: acyl-CoA thioesterase [Bacillales bacterium]|nr:acyl-CoA thioesterase [Bacillales bacterium]